MKYRYILFDMDGTVLETLEDLCGATNATLEHFGFPPITLEQCRSYVGNGARRQMEQSLPAGTADETVDRVLEYYIPYYASHSLVKTAPYPGITEMLETICRAGARCAVVSNKPDATCKRLSDEFFGNCMETAIGQSDSIARKPAPDTVLEAIRLMGADKSECVYVGDSEVDLLTARNAGIPCISVLWGFRTREQLETAGADTFAGTPEELVSLIL